jgi:hypothetical protein
MLRHRCGESLRMEVEMDKGSKILLLLRACRHIRCAGENCRHIGEAHTGLSQPSLSDVRPAGTRLHTSPPVIA